MSHESFSFFENPTERLLAVWRDVLGEYRLETRNLFADVRLDDVHGRMENDEYVLWSPERNEAQARHRLQRALDSNRFDHGLRALAVDKYREGQQSTALYLADVRAQPDLVAKVLLLASLFSRLDSTRKGDFARKHWPDLSEVRSFQRSLLDDLGQRFGDDFGWHQSCTDVIPITRDDYYALRATDMDSLVVYLAEEHARLLSSYKVYTVSPAVSSDGRHLRGVTH